MRILVLVLATLQRPYPDLIRTQKRTWAARDVENVDVLFYYGGARFSRQGRDLYVVASDDYWSTGEKTLACFEYALNNLDFDLIFRTNCSSYVDLPNLETWTRDHARVDQFYAGTVLSVAREQALTVRRDGVRPAPGIEQPEAGWFFASGAGYFLSRDLAELVIEQRSLWDHSYVDDMALGRLLSQQNIVPAQIPRVVLRTPWQPKTLDTTQFLFRCKTDSSWRRGDVELLLKVDKAFINARDEEVARWYTLRRRLKIKLRRLAPTARRRRSSNRPRQQAT